MDRRKALKNIGTALSLPLIPLGLLAKEEQISTTKVTIDPELAKANHAIWDNLESIESEAGYLNHMYPVKWEYEINIEYDSHSSNKPGTWIS